MIALTSVSLLIGCNDTPSPAAESGSTSEDGAEESTSSTSLVDETSADSTGEPQTTGPTCDTLNQVPATPVVMGPVDGTRNLDPADLVIESSAFSDPDGDPHAASEFEIWRVDNGTPITRVWSASTTEGGALTQVTLEDGEFEGASAVLGGLRLWEDHVVRVRHSDGAEGECGFSEWSEDVAFKTDDGSAYLFDQTVIHDIHIEIPPESWDPINDQAYPPGCVPWNREYYEGRVTFEDQVFEGVGVRTKGGCGSSRDLNGKAGFRINLGWDDPSVPGCPEKQRLFGQKHLTLNNMVQDDTFMHERLAYRLYEAMGVPVPRVAHIRVHVNNQHWGLYLLVETPKRRFLDRRFDSKNGMLYEGTYWCDLIPENVPPGDQDDYCLERKFSPSECDDDPEPDEDPKDYTVLREMVDQIDAFPPGGYYPEIQGLFSFGPFLSAWATEGVVAHWDNYAFNIMNNYRVYRDPSTDLWNLIPHGVDQTFEGNLDPWNVSGTLAVRCMGEPACEDAFAARLDQVNDAFEAMNLAAEVDVIDALIADYVYADPRKEVADFEYDFLRGQTKQWIEQRPDQVRAILSAHGF